MSTIAEQRAEILAALETLEFLHVHDTRPGTVNEGVTWVRWAGSGGRSGNGAPAWWMDRWHVFIVLYGDEAVLEAWCDAHVDAIGAALDRIAPIDAIEPVDLTVDVPGGPGAATVPAIRITCSRE